MSTSALEQIKGAEGNDLMLLTLAHLLRIATRQSARPFDINDAFKVLTGEKKLRR